MNGLPNNHPNHMNTSQRIYHVFGCNGSQFHITPGFALLRTPNANVCPQCGASVEDITSTPVGRAYFAFTRPDLGGVQ